MTLTPDDISAVLTKSAGYDSAHTPRNAAILTAAWLEHFGRYAPTATRAQVLEAVAEYHREPHDRMLQPGDLTAIIRVQTREHIARLDPAERDRRNTGTDMPDYPAEWSPEERLSAYWYVVKNRAAHPATTENWRTILRAARRGREDGAA